MTEIHQDAAASSDSIASTDSENTSAFGAENEGVTYEDAAFDGDGSEEDDFEEEAAPVSETFAGVSSALRDAMVRRGFTDLTAVQKAVLGDGLDGKDLRISSQTGS